MGARISHMNLYALSTLVMADESDLENLLRNFEGKKNTYPKVLHKGKEVENVPIRANRQEEQYIVDEMEVVLERQEAEAKAKADALQAIKDEEEAKIRREREAKFAAKNARAAGKLGKKELEELKLQEIADAKAAEEKRTQEKEEAYARPATMLADILPDTVLTRPSAGDEKNTFADAYEAELEAGKAPEKDEFFNQVDSASDVKGGSPLSAGNALGSDEKLQTDFRFGLDLEPGSVMGERGGGGGGMTGGSFVGDDSVRVDDGASLASVQQEGLGDGVSLLDENDLLSLGGEQASVHFDLNNNSNNNGVMPTLPGGLAGAELGEDIDDAISALAERDDQFNIDAPGSLVSVAGGGSIHSTTSVTSEMVDVNSKVTSFYTEMPLSEPKGSNLPESYLIHIEKMLAMTRLAGFDESDVDLMEAMFRLVDQRGFEEADIRHVLVPMALAVGCKNGSISNAIKLIFTIFDRACTDIVSKQEMLQIFNLVNEGILYIGDKPLDANYIVDLTDSIFTEAGRIDGYVQWIEYVELIAEHPIIEMLIAPQYQGLARDKVFDEETLLNVDVCVGVDYTEKKGNNIK